MIEKIVHEDIVHIYKDVNTFLSEHELKGINFINKIILLNGNYRDLSREFKLI